MRTENLRPTRLLRVRELPGNGADKPGTRKDRTGKSRFVAPYYFQAAEQDAIGQCLQQAGIGDDEGRKLFLTAAEYEVGAYRLSHTDRPAPRPVPKPKPRTKTKAEIELEGLRDAVHQLLGMLSQTHKTARATLGEALTASDPFGRVHDERYLTQLEHELSRVAEACGRETAETEPEEPRPPPVSVHAKRFVGQLARIYRECLETELKSEELGTFCQVLCLIRDAAEIDLPCEADVVGKLV